MTRYRSSLIGNVFVVRWSEPPQVVDNVTILQDLRAARQRAEAPLLFCNIVSDATDVPSAEVRAHAVRITPEILELCDSMHLVLEGEGLVRSLLRTVIRGMILAGRSGGRVFLHNSFDDFLRKNLGKISLDPTTMASRARGVGVVV